MDLGFTPPSPADAAPLPPTDAARVVAALIAQAGETVPIERPAAASAAPLAPAGGAFSAAMATRLAEWQHE